MNGTSPRQIWNSLLCRRSSQGWRKVHFIVPHQMWGSALTRGHQISRALNRKGVYSRVLDLSSGEQQIQVIKNSVVVFIKVAFRGRPDLLTRLKGKGNILIWDPIDGLVDLKGEEGVKLFDGVMLPNRECEERMRPFFREDCRCGIIYHHWDPRIRKNRARGYGLVYLGDTTPENINPAYIEGIPELNILKCNSVKTFKENNLLGKIRDYNCHFSVREKDHDSFYYKPNTKLSFASATDSNIILSREFSNVELLDPAYPYYADGDLESVRRAVQYSRETYGTKVWDQALAMIRDVRERTSIKRIADDYIRFFKSF